MPQFDVGEGTLLDALPVIITLSPTEWNQLRQLVTEHIDAPGWCQRTDAIQRLVREIQKAPPLTRGRVFQDASRRSLGEDS